MQLQGDLMIFQQILNWSDQPYVASACVEGCALILILFVATKLRNYE